MGFMCADPWHPMMESVSAQCQLSHFPFICHQDLRKLLSYFSISLGMHNLMSTVCTLCTRLFVSSIIVLPGEQHVCKY